MLRCSSQPATAKQARLYRAPVRQGRQLSSSVLLGSCVVKAILSEYRRCCVNLTRQRGAEPLLASNKLRLGTQATKSPARPVRIGVVNTLEFSDNLRCCCLTRTEQHSPVVRLGDLPGWILDVAKMPRRPFKTRTSTEVPQMPASSTHSAKPEPSACCKTAGELHA